MGDASYITDVAYTGNFAPFLAPAALAYTAVLNGYRPPDFNRGFTYCELGCGKGVSSLVLAAMHAHGEFHACDINAAHIEHAAALQRAAAVANLRLHTRSVEQMQEAADLPAFDFIVAHGLYSWVPDQVRGQIRAFIHARLKPGGLVFLSYNALPGWAPLLPIRAMLRAYAAHVPGDSFTKARAAFAYAQRLADGGANVFQASPAARAQLAEIARHDIRYVAHEYLTPHGDPFWFADVERALRESELVYADSLTPSDNYTELMVPSKLADPIATGSSRTMLETHFDFVANTPFRRDLYARQKAMPLPAALPLERFAPFEFALARLPEQLPLESAAGAVRFNLRDRASEVRAIHARLAAAPADAEAIHQAAGWESESETSLLIQQLAVAQHLIPVPRQRPSLGWPRLNSALIDSALRERQASVPLGAPATAAATPFETVHAVLVEAMASEEEAAPATSTAFARLRAAGHPVELEGPGGQRRAASDVELRAVLSSGACRLQDGTSTDRRVLQQLGLLVCAGTERTTLP
ncbi:MAG: class I SAM-dependent methyltransferase [Burkholderiaceae bacterium]